MPQLNLETFYLISFKERMTVILSLLCLIASHRVTVSRDKVTKQDEIEKVSSFLEKRPSRYRP